MKCNTKKEEIVAVASNLFSRRSFKDVSLSELGALLSIKPASLYYYFPEGKEQLYLYALEQELSKYKQQLDHLLISSNNLKQLLLEFSNWYSQQAPMNMEVINQIDMPQLSKRGQSHIKKIIFQCVFGPLSAAIQQFGSQLRSNIKPMRLTGVYFSLLGSVSLAATSGYDNDQNAMNDSILMLLDGVLA